MHLGTFSISLAVKDLAASRAFYAQLGFEVIDGNEAHNWLMLQNGSAKIGLFQGMFEQNIITFNPPDVLAIQDVLKAKGQAIALEADPNHPQGWLAMSLTDPDGNQVLLDQLPAKD